MNNQFPVKPFILTELLAGGDKLEHQFFYSAVSSTPQYRMFTRPFRKQDQEALKGHECTISTEGSDAIRSAKRILKSMVEA